MAESEQPTDGVKPVRPGRIDRHRIAREAAAAAPVEAVEAVDPAVPAAPAATEPARRIRTFRPGRAPAKDKTGSAVRRPALLSERCLTCGAGTKGRAGMVTELVEVGPIRALRVIACSACPDRRRRGLTGP